MSLKTKTLTRTPATGINKQAISKIVDQLHIVLANTQVLGIKTLHGHWNIVGPHFYSIHKLLEEQYKDLFEALDPLAERIRSLGHPVAASNKEFLAMTKLEEFGPTLTAEKILEDLAADHAKVAANMKDLFILAEESHDFVTADMLVEFMQKHEEAVWMLQAILA